MQVMREYEVFNLVFSSSATIYGVPQYLPVDENHPTGACTNPYGRTKYFLEQLMYDMANADKVSEECARCSFITNLFQNLSRIHNDIRYLEKEKLK